MTKPVNYADWATDANYAAGVETYSGTPTKVLPQTQEITKGNIPGALPTAQKFNSYQNTVGQWVRWLDSGDSERTRELLGRVPNLDGTKVPTEPGYDASLSKFVFSATTSAAHPKQGSANNKVKISAGTLLQAVSSTAIYAYTFDGTTEVTIADAAGATPRVDLIQLKIEPDATVDTLRTKVTVSVKQGTPAASPVVPLADAGYVAYATVVVGASYAHAAGFAVDDTAGAVAVLHDQRMPLGVKSYSLVGTQFSRSNIIQDGTNGWTDENKQQYIIGAVAAPSNALARLPATEDDGRLLMHMTTLLNPTSSVVVHRLVRDRINSAAAASATTLNGDSVGLLTSGSSTTVLWVSRGDFENQHLPGAGPTVLQSADNVGVPIWANGRRCWHAPPIIDAVNDLTYLSVEFSTVFQNTRLYRTQFWLAGR